MPRTISAHAKAYVRRAAEFQFDCTIRVFKNTVPALNTTTGMYDAVEGAEIYNGPARIWSSNSGGIINIGEADLATTATFCSIPWDANPVPDIDDSIEVLTSPNDAHMVGRAFRIVQVDGGGQARATRKMQVVGITENRSWDG